MAAGPRKPASGPINTGPMFEAVVPPPDPPKPCVVCHKAPRSDVVFRCLKCLEETLCSPECAAEHDKCKPTDLMENCKSRSQRKCQSLRTLIGVCAGNRISEAVRASRQLLCLLHYRNGPTHGSLLEPLRHLRELLEASDPEMVGYAMRVVRIQEVLSGASSAPVAEGLNDLAKSLLLAQGQAADALDRLERASRLVERLPPSDYHQGLQLGVMATQCRAYRRLGRWPECLSAYRKFMSGAFKAHQHQRQALEEAVAEHGIALVRDMLLPRDCDDKMLNECMSICDWAIDVHTRGVEEAASVVCGGGGAGSAGGSSANKYPPAPEGFSSCSGIIGGAYQPQHIRCERKLVWALTSKARVMLAKGNIGEADALLKSVTVDNDVICKDWMLKAEVLALEARICRLRGGGDGVVRSLGLWWEVRRLLEEHRGQDGERWNWEDVDEVVCLATSLLASGDVLQSEACARWAIRRMLPIGDATQNGGAGSGGSSSNDDPHTRTRTRTPSPSPNTHDTPHTPTDHQQQMTVTYRSGLLRATTTVTVGPYAAVVTLPNSVGNSPLTAITTSDVALRISRLCPIEAKHAVLMTYARALVLQGGQDKLEEAEASCETSLHLLEKHKATLKGALDVTVKRHQTCVAEAKRQLLAVRVVLAGGHLPCDHIQQVPQSNGGDMWSEALQEARRRVKEKEKKRKKNAKRKKSKLKNREASSDQLQGAAGEDDEDEVVLTPSATYLQQGATTPPPTQDAEDGQPPQGPLCALCDKPVAPGDQGGSRPSTPVTGEAVSCAQDCALHDECTETWVVVSREKGLVPTNACPRCKK